MDTISPFQELPDERSWIRKYGLKILSLVLGGFFGLFTINVVSKIGSNTMGFNLTMISLLFLDLGFVLIISSYIEKRKIDVIWENHTVLNNNVNFPFTIKNDSLALAFINSEKGHTTFQIREFESSIKEEIEPRILYQSAITRGDMLQTPFIELPKGVYHLSFRGDKNIIFSFVYIFSEKPYSQMFSVGLTLLEVSLPLLVTGLLLQMFNFTI